MEIKSFFDPATFTLTYLVFDPSTQDAVILDPVLDFDPASGKTSTSSIQKLWQVIEGKKLKVLYILETHAHADHLSGAHELVENYLPEAKIGIGERIQTVQKTFKPLPLEFYIAAKQGDIGQVRELIARGAHINAQIGDGKTALIGAALSGKIAMVTELLVLHADPQQPQLLQTLGGAPPTGNPGHHEAG
jgi:glyoxylase-like metal-dependent hydrolase (beta-lactamase superfamily II)